MNSLKWNDEFETGIEKIDNQHKELFRRTQMAIDSLLKDDEEGIRDVLMFLNDYIVEHFNDEEEFQKEISYPKYDEHKAKHENLVHKVKELIEEFKKSKDKSVVSITINTFLVDWLINHISQEDKGIANYYKNLTK